MEWRLKEISRLYWNKVFSLQRHDDQIKYGIGKLYYYVFFDEKHSRHDSYMGTNRFEIENIMFNRIVSPYSVEFRIS